MKGIIIIGHGSRANDAKDIFLKVVEGLKEKLDTPNVEGCFMELSEPYIPRTIDKMYNEGVRDFTVLPYFLFPGIHIKEDIPEILNECKEKYGDISIKLAEPIGYHDSLIDILKERIQGETKCI
ncbi:cobalamin (vitamin B12) biosynthesis protein CbiX [Gottschalkia acidurici 9a]|uniref:Cobalamin (Vitamin B12) biosynthesis protein CbiX n=1 Tax=Gottschalkia acidurici (strain ATCC 7906 / DSM 604 / BCRC 14475 / CIP 104303 / KCTC 5404 / NCIMB 10678 / 9a) TaxID=1128398 RepID=K0B2V9_GOTA9|nr:CbiX/SirB N-terminal domain-containing protein [Gottschalkia acidurici]AFS79487.1 cobalamin (vitamin B12) biosynthesis protein CbiX [Gottschalkia acidurici 9a]